MTNNLFLSWLEKSIAKDYINFHNYDEFQNIEQIGTGAFGKVCRATWKNSDTIVALKYLKNDNIVSKEFFKELELLHEVNSHTNIIKFLGITKREKKGIENYLLILEHADSGTLRDYLKDNFSKLNWNAKLQLAAQIANGVSYIHQKNIVHRDLHSSNLLVHQNVIKLADFGLSRRIAERSNSLRDIFGTLSYVDPQYFKEQTNSNGHYKVNKKSDVYSVGVLLWEISSGKKPFESYDEYHRKARLILDILEGKRETSINGTPIDYINIYTECWQDNPDDRPDMLQVLSDLKSIDLTNDENKPEKKIDRAIEERMAEYDNHLRQRKTKMIKSKFTQRVDKIIIECMKEYGHLPNAYAMISKKIPQYTSKRIRHRWANELNPRLCNDPLSDEEKQFIIQRASNGNKINWTKFIEEINCRFGKFRPENMVKNFWYSRKKQLENLPPPENLPLNFEYSEDPYLQNFF